MVIFYLTLIRFKFYYLHVVTIGQHNLRSSKSGFRNLGCLCLQTRGPAGTFTLPENPCCISLILLFHRCHCHRCSSQVISLEVLFPEYSTAELTKAAAGRRRGKKLCALRSWQRGLGSLWVQGFQVARVGQFLQQ